MNRPLQTITMLFRSIVDASVSANYPQANNYSGQDHVSHSTKEYVCFSRSGADVFVTFPGSEGYSAALLQLIISLNAIDASGDELSLPGFRA